MIIFCYSVRHFFLNGRLYPVQYTLYIGYSQSAIANQKALGAVVTFLKCLFELWGSQLWNLANLANVTFQKS
jgi:hypothetical protein